MTGRTAVVAFLDELVDALSHHRRSASAVSVPAAPGATFAARLRRALARDEVEPPDTYAGGTTVGLRGGAVDEAEPAAAYRGNAEEPATGLRVLIAESEPLTRLDFAEMLAAQGYQVVAEADDGENAVRLATALRPDLVVMGVMLPVLDGITATEHITAARIAPVVLVAPFAGRDLTERAIAAGAMAYLTKPVQGSDLTAAIEIAVSRFAELAALEAEVASLTERLDSRRLVNRARDLLMARYGMAEPEAFRWIQRTATERRSTMREVAERLLAEQADDAGTAE